MAIHAPAPHNNLISVLKKPNLSFRQTSQFVLRQVAFQQTRYTQILSVGIDTLASLECHNHVE